jgi:hypothetical protein
MRTLPALSLLIVVVSACMRDAAPDDDDDDDDDEEKRALYEPCETSDECASRLCDPRAGCVPNECERGCERGDVCASHGTTLLCESPGLRGEQCSYRDDVGSRFEKACVDGLVCDTVRGGFSVVGTCVPPSNRARGEPCHSDNVCDIDLVCSDRAERCQALPGAACDEDDECTTLDCGPNRVCVLDECGALLAECDDGAGLFCSGGPCGRSCAAPRGLGDACRVDDPVCPAVYACAVGLACDDVTGSCSAATMAP